MDRQDGHQLTEDWEVEDDLIHGDDHAQADYNRIRREHRDRRGRRDR